MLITKSLPVNYRNFFLITVKQNTYFNCQKFKYNYHVLFIRDKMSPIKIIIKLSSFARRLKLLENIITLFSSTAVQLELSNLIRDSKTVSR